MAHWLGCRCTFRCGLEQVTFTLLSAGETLEAVDGRPTWTDCDEAGDYVVPNVLSPRDLVFRPDNMDETVPHTEKISHDAAQILIKAGFPLHFEIDCTFALFSYFCTLNV